MSLETRDANQSRCVDTPAPAKLSASRPPRATAAAARRGRNGNSQLLELPPIRTLTRVDLRPSLADRSSYPTARRQNVRVIDEAHAAPIHVSRSPTERRSA